MAQHKKALGKAAAAIEEAVVRGNPRRYQTALLVELAKKQNTIVNLGHVLGLNGPLADTEVDRRSEDVDTSHFGNILRVHGIFAMPLT